MALFNQIGLLEAELSEWCGIIRANEFEGLKTLFAPILEKHHETDETKNYLNYYKGIPIYK